VAQRGARENNSLKITKSWVRSPAPENLRENMTQQFEE
jgi:hypothetical protein